MVVDINLALSVADKLLDYLLKIHDDIPAEERRKFHERAGKFWDVVWQHADKKPDA